MALSKGEKLDVVLNGDSDTVAAYYYEADQREPGTHVILVMPDNRYTLVSDEDIKQAYAEADAMTNAEIETRMRGTTEINHEGGAKLAEINNTQVEQFKAADEIVSNLTNMANTDIRPVLGELQEALEQKIAVPTMYSDAQEMERDVALLNSISQLEDSSNDTIQSVIDKSQIEAVGESLELGEPNALLDDFDPESLGEDSDVLDSVDNVFYEGEGEADEFDNLKTPDDSRIEELAEDHPANIDREDGRSSNEPPVETQQAQVSAWGAIGYGVGSLMGAAAEVGMELARKLRDKDRISVRANEVKESKYDEYMDSAGRSLSRVSEIVAEVSVDADVTTLLDRISKDDGTFAAAQDRLEATDMLNDVLETKYGQAISSAMGYMDDVTKNLSNAQELASERFGLRGDMASELMERTKEAEEENEFLSKLTVGDPDLEPKVGIFAELLKKIRETVQSVVQTMSNESDNEARLTFAPRP